MLSALVYNRVFMGNLYFVEESNKLFELLLFILFIHNIVLFLELQFFDSFCRNWMAESDKNTANWGVPFFYNNPVLHDENCWFVGFLISNHDKGETNPFNIKGAKANS
ncbi:hypothetical protein DMUE_4348 [Dictyocoela muelleri]|nr:hypothetical protein DMUE_4348 [Dictyocoela muelleri]